MRYKSLKKIACLLIFILSFQATSSNLSIQKTCKANPCIAVFDVGSTGTRLSLFTYHKNSTNQYQLKEVYEKKITPELNSLLLNQQSINKYLNQFLIPDTKDIDIPTFFYATAGMRFLSTALQNEYYSLVRHWFNNQSTFNINEIRTITGREEGIFGWLSIYDLLKKTNPEQANTFGLMDMGGGSNQITFPVRQQEVKDPMDLIQLNINNKPITLYSKSFLGLGNTSALKQFLNFKSCFLKNYKLPNSSLANGNAIACHQHVLDFINDTHRVNRIITPIMQSSHANNWFVMGALGYLVNDKHFNFLDNKFSPTMLLEQSHKKFCTQNWDHVDSKLKKDRFFYTNCFRGAYYYALLVHGYGLKPNSSVRFLDLSMNAGWIKGAVLYHLLTEKVS